MQYIQLKYFLELYLSKGCNYASFKQGEQQFRQLSIHWQFIIFVININEIRSKVNSWKTGNCSDERQVSLICQLISTDNYSIMFLVLCFIFISSLDLANHEICCGSSFTGLCYKSVSIFSIGSGFLFCFVSVCQILKKSKRQSPLEFLKLCNEFTSMKVAI